MEPENITNDLKTRLLKPVAVTKRATQIVGLGVSQRTRRLLQEDWEENSPKDT